MHGSACIVAHGVSTSIVICTAASSPVASPASMVADYLGMHGQHTPTVSTMVREMHIAGHSRPQHQALVAQHSKRTSTAIAIVMGAGSAVDIAWCAIK